MRFIMFMIPAVYQDQSRPMPEHAPPADKIAAMLKLNEDLKAAGALIALDGLHPTDRGARVRFDGASPTVQEGPFPGARDVVGGYWIIRAASKSEAIDWARRVPADPGDVIEVRQIQDLDDFPAESIAPVRERLQAVGEGLAP